MKSRAGTTGQQTTKNADQPAVKPPKAKGAGFAVFLSLVSLVGAGAAIGGGYYFFTKEYLPLKNAMQSATVETQQQLTTQSEALAGQMQQQMQSVEQINHNVVAKQESLQTTFDDIVEDLGILKYKANWSQREWTLAEVGYLVRMANDRLLYMRDVETSKAAVRTAMRRIDHLADPSLASLQQTLASDLQSLNLYSPPDATQVLAKLEGMLTVLKPYPTQTDKVGAEQAAEAAESEVAETREETLVEEEQPFWRAFVQTASEELKNRVRVVRHEQRLNALDQSTVQQSQLEMAKLRLEAMRMALQREDAAAFQRELLALDAWSQSNLAEKNAIPVREELQRLASEPLFPPLPTLSGTMTALADLLQDPSMEAAAAPELPEASPESAVEVMESETTAIESSTEVATEEPVVTITVEDTETDGVSELESAPVAEEPAESQEGITSDEGASLDAVSPVEMPEVKPSELELPAPGAPTNADLPTVDAEQDSLQPALEEQAVPLPEAVLPDAAGKPEVM